MQRGDWTTYKDDTGEEWPALVVNVDDAGDVTEYVFGVPGPAQILVIPAPEPAPEPAPAPAPPVDLAADVDGIAANVKDLTPAERAELFASLGVTDPTINGGNTA